jgi:hypothetical protein
MDALAELAGEVTEELGDRRVEIRLDAGEVRVVVSTAPEAIEEPEVDAEETGGESSRITLRLPEELKAKAERAAAAQDSSLNTWLVQVVRDAVRAAPQRGRGRQHRVRGWVES